jgi:hypothetical protein
MWQWRALIGEQKSVPDIKAAAGDPNINTQYIFAFWEVFYEGIHSDIGSRAMLAVSRSKSEKPKRDIENLTQPILS